MFYKFQKHSVTPKHSSADDRWPAAAYGLHIDSEVRCYARRPLTSTNHGRRQPDIARMPDLLYRLIQSARHRFRVSLRARIRGLARYSGDDDVDG